MTFIGIPERLRTMAEEYESGDMMSVDLALATHHMGHEVFSGLSDGCQVNFLREAFGMTPREAAVLPAAYHKKLMCWKCHKVVSTPVPGDTLIRGTVECPECVESTVEPDKSLSDAIRSKMRAEPAFPTVPRSVVMGWAERVQALEERVAWYVEGRLKKERRTVHVYRVSGEAVVKVTQKRDGAARHAALQQAREDPTLFHEPIAGNEFVAVGPFDVEEEKR